ncbi:alpha/beta hydrolase [Bacillus sp. SA1-12]|uniref:alpha/beta-type small acid-soluble spore protein n=1 Tax=Bacillus sp. SA1-12 TaxID=1455638 RepID=UPI00062661A2|nr:alpha/beta-type small acid-soluble spore protein [Bacillus sp. SA1-12]KKI94023.1 alpha/beta hydrolase [Bacillus sp. SA1-12]
MARRRNKLLVPEARDGVDQLKAKVANTQKPEEAKFEVAKEVGVPLQDGYNGGLTSRQAGKIGGNLGGNMVREMVKMAEQQLKNQK